MILLTLLWLVAGVIVVVGILVVAWTQPPSIDVVPPVAHPRAVMRLVFVTVQDDHVVIDGLLDLDPPSLGIPTSWSFACPTHPVLASATIDVLERWADDGMPVELDLSKVSSIHPSVALLRGEVFVRLLVLPRSSQHEQSR